MLWWPIGMAIGSVVWGLVWAGLWTLDVSTDYEANTSEWKFICQWSRCEDLVWNTYSTNWKVITKTYCE